MSRAPALEGGRGVGESLLAPAGERKYKEVNLMEKRQHGWLVAVFIKGQSGVAYDTFCKKETDALKEKEIAYRYNSDVECVTIDEVFYNLDTGGYVPA